MEENCQYGIWKNRLPFQALVLNRGAICDSLGCRELLHIAYLSRKKVECGDVILSLKVNLRSIRFSSVFLRFSFLLKKYAHFHPCFYKSIYALTRQSHAGQKYPKKLFCKGVQLYFEISLLSFIHKIFEQKFYLYTAVYLVRIWTYGLKKCGMKKRILFQESKT